MIRHLGEVFPTESYLPNPKVTPLKQAPRMIRVRWNPEDHESRNAVVLQQVISEVVLGHSIIGMGYTDGRIISFELLQTLLREFAKVNISYEESGQI